MAKKHKVGIIGASGYTGYELIKILCKHQHVELVVLNSESYAGKKVSELYPDFLDEKITFTNYTIYEINKMKLDLVFLAVPHTTAMALVPKLNCKIVDLSADYRFKNPKEYEQAYKLEHKDRKTKAVYGLSELSKKNKTDIKNAKLVANPGCYATGMILSVFPIQKLANYIVFDCKSGWSGAGKSSIYAKDASVIKNNIVAYNLSKHRHKYEVAQFIKTKFSFTPHVIDTFQGMMITAHLLLKEDKKNQKNQKNQNLTQTQEKMKQKVIQIFKNHFKDCPFVEISDKIPDIHVVQKTNKLIIGGFEIDENNQMVIIAVLDNLVKGASGQAVQNMNIMLNIDEKEGLI
ncbi:MAG: N-acetyl-gamma-glutamyl-phosphate reductase [Nanoarchaeota archaeon]|nr:N-acetyl-gamma-glutamyl-phosphate reductase [Nanoarchaeota archaeon]